MSDALILELIRLGFEIWRTNLKSSGKTEEEIDKILEEDWKKFIARPASALKDV